MTELWAHQRQAIANAFSTHNYALFFEMGTGKTRTTIEIMRALFNAQGRVMRSLIYTLPLPVPQWREEWLKFTKLHKNKITLLQGPGPKRLKNFLQQIEKDPDQIFITNWEALLMKPLFSAMQVWRPEVVVFDESHKAKSHKSKRSKAAFEMANPRDWATKKALPKPNTYILTGSPVLKDTLDLFQQMKILDGGRTFGQNFFAFRGMYFRDRNAGMPDDRYFPNWEIMNLEKDGVDGLQEIQKKLAPVSMRVEKKDCLDLPPEVSISIKVPMAKEQQRLYDEMQDDLVTYYRSKAVVATMALTKALRLMQIASGFVAAHTPGEEDARVELDLGDTPKLLALRDLIEQIVVEGQGKVLIWAVFKHNYGQIRKVCSDLGVKFVEVHGEISEKEKLKNVETFQKDESVKVFIGHPGSGGVGVNLTVAGYSIFYSRNFSLEHFLQARARNHRGGSKEAGHTSITHYDLICEGTIEEDVVSSLNEKQVISDRVLSSIIYKKGPDGSRYKISQ